MTLIAPTGARLITFYDHCPSLRGRLVCPPSLYWPTQGPGEIVVLGADFGMLTGCAPVISASVTTSDDALVVAQSNPAGTAINFVAYCGTPGANATIGLTANYADGQVRYREALLPIAPASTIAPGVPVSTSVTTTDATPTVIATARAVSGVVMRLSSKVLAVSGANVAAWDLAALVVGLGGTPTLDGDASPAPFRISDALSAVTITAVPVAGGVNLVATGLAGVSIAWSARMEMEVA